MTEINRIRVFGWLPAGLVLNTRLETDMSKNIIIPQLASMGASSDRALVGISQASEKIMYRLKGEFRSPVILADIASHSVTPFQEVNLEECQGYINIDPFSQACMLMTSVLFEGEVVTFTGDDCQFTTISLDQVDLSPCLTLRVKETDEQAYELCFRCSMYLPSHSVTQGVYGMDKNSGQAYCSGVRGFQVKLLADDDPQVDLYGGMTLIAAFNEFRMPVRAAMGMTPAYRQDGTTGEETIYALPRVVGSTLDRPAFASVDLTYSQRVFALDMTTRTVLELGAPEIGNAMLAAIHVSDIDGEVHFEDSILLGVAELPSPLETTVDL